MRVGIVLFMGLLGSLGIGHCDSYGQIAGHPQQATEDFFANRSPLESEVGDGTAGISMIDRPLYASSGVSFSSTSTVAEPLASGLRESPAASVSPAVSVSPAATAKASFPSYKLSGVFQLDSAYFAQSAESRAVLGDIQDGTGFRRARLAASGNFSERGSYLFEFDFAQAQARFVDVWGQFSETPLGNVRIGRYRQPFGMSELTSVRELPLLERPVTFALTPFRQTGVMLFDTALDEQLTWAVSGFRTVSDNFGNVYGDDGGYGTAERLTIVWDGTSEERLMHWGFGHSYIAPGREQWQIASQDEIFIGQNPNLGPGGLSVLPLVNVPPFVNTGIFDLENANLFNVEAALSRGAFATQAEYRWVNLQLPSGDEATVHGGYVTLRWLLTGELIPYNRAGGVFGRVVPNRPLDITEGNWGAWELVSRLSTIDLNDMFGRPGVPGPTRRLNTVSLGLNWYMLERAKCQVEWVVGSLDDPVQGNSVSNTVASRAQFDF